MKEPFIRVPHEFGEGTPEQDRFRKTCSLYTGHQSFHMFRGREMLGYHDQYGIHY